MATFLTLEEAKRSGLLPHRFKSPIFILWELTYACPLRCVFCYNSSGGTPSPSLPIESAIRIAQEIGEANVLFVCLSGGEPLCYSGYFEVAQKLREYDVSLGTITNGWLVNQEKAAKMVGLFDSIQVSIDGAMPQTHDSLRQVKGSFERAMNALQLLDEEIELVKRRGQRIPVLAVSFVANKLNIKEFGTYIDLMATRFKNLKVIRTQPVTPVGRARSRADITLSPYDLTNMLEICQRKIIEFPHLHIEFGLPTTHLLKAVQGFPWEVLTIDPKGNVRFSPWLPGVVGNLLQSSLQEVWENKLSRIHLDESFIESFKKVVDVNDFRIIAAELEKRFGPFGGGELKDDIER